MLVGATEDNADLLGQMAIDPDSLSESELTELNDVFENEEFNAADEREVARELDN